MTQFKYTELIRRDLHPRQVLARLAQAIEADLETGSHEGNNVAAQQFASRMRFVYEEMNKVADELDAMEPVEEYYIIAELVEKEKHGDQGKDSPGSGDG